MQLPLGSEAGAERPPTMRNPLGSPLPMKLPLEFMLGTDDPLNEAAVLNGLLQ